MRIGCAGFQLKREKYFSIFNFIEIQETFYREVEEKRLIKWRKEAPSNFEFSLKALQLLTHPPNSPTYRRYRGQIPEECGFLKKNNITISAWAKTVSMASVLNAKFVILQFPKSFKPEDENIKNMFWFFNEVYKEEISVGIEVRASGWEKIIYLLCKSKRIFHVVDPFSQHRICGEVEYYRLHGKGNYKYKFTDNDFLFLLNKIGKKAYIVFNNVFAKTDSLKFKEFIERRMRINNHQ